MLPDFSRNVLIDALGGTPTLAATLFAGIPDDDPRWELRPDSERFSLREIPSHLATLDAIWLERLHRAVTEDNPVIGPATMHSGETLANTPSDNLALLKTRREQITALLGTLNNDQWLRPLPSTPLGPLITETMAMFIAVHDAYHFRQINEWLNA